MLKALWFGYGGHAHMAEKLRPMINDLGMKLVTIHEHSNADVKWDLNTWKQELNKADIVILPANVEKFPSKSNNKLTQAMAYGKPVICSPQHSYKIIEERYPGCCLFAESEEDWKRHLQSLRDNEKLRQEISQKATEACKDYSIDVIGAKWASLFTDIDKVDIVIPTYNNLPCLKLCLDSIRACTSHLYNIIVVNSGPDKELHEYLERQGDIQYIRRGKMSFAQAVNVGIRAGNSKYIMILNDDVIVSRGWLSKLGDVCKDPGVGIVGPLSNCDKGWLHKYDINIGGVNLLPGVNTPDQVIPIIPKIYDFVSPYKEIVDRDWVAFYCTLIPRSVIDKVGILDDKFVNSGEDVDLCNRIKKMGYKIVQNYESFVFHFGAVSRKLLEQEDRGSYQKADAGTQSYLKEKWGKENIVIYTGPSWERWDFRNVDSGGIGGSETWAVELARQFDKMGYRVKVFADCPEQGIMDGGVEYLHYKSYNDYIEQNWIDYFISSRTTDPFRFPVRAGKKYVMIHDLWLLSNKDQLFLDKVDKFCALSKWHIDFAANYHGIPKEKMWMTQNGLDFTRFDQKVERHPYRLIYSSSPDRGLDTLLYLFDFIKAEIPEAELHIFYGFENWRKSIKTNGKDWEIKKMEEIEAGFKKPGVVYHGRVGQKELAQEFLKSSLWAYSTDFEESFCITAIEAQRARVPVLTSNYAGLRTTVGDSGILIGNGTKGQSYTKEYREEFVRHAIELLTDNSKWKEWSERGFQNTERFSWEKTAQKWVGLFHDS